VPEYQTVDHVKAESQEELISDEREWMCAVHESLAQACLQVEGYLIHSSTDLLKDT